MAQTGTGSIQGTVRDATGAVLPGWWKRLSEGGIQLTPPGPICWQGTLKYNPLGFGNLIWPLSELYFGPTYR